MPSRAMPWPEKLDPPGPANAGAEAPGRTRASLSGRLRPRNTTPVRHSSAERAPLPQACFLSPGTGSSTKEPRTRTRSLGVTIPSRTRASREASKRWGRSFGSCSSDGRRGSGRSAVAGAGVGRAGLERGNSAAGAGSGEIGGGGVRGGAAGGPCHPPSAAEGPPPSDWAITRVDPAKGAPQATASNNGRRRRSIGGRAGKQTERRRFETRLNRPINRRQCKDRGHPLARNGAGRFAGHPRNAGPIPPDG